jgi:hypothetical protein
VVADQHEVSGDQVVANAARGIGDDQRVASTGDQRAYGQHDRLRAQPLVEVHAALHGEHGGVAAFATNQLARVASDGARRKPGDFVVGNDALFLQLVSEVAKAPIPTPTRCEADGARSREQFQREHGKRHRTGSSSLLVMILATIPRAWRCLLGHWCFLRPFGVVQWSEAAKLDADFSPRPARYRFVGRG